MPGMQDYVSARWILKTVFQSVAALGRDLSWEGFLSTGSYPSLCITGAITPPRRAKGIQKNSMLVVGPAQRGVQPGPAAGAQWLVPTRKLPWWARRSAASTGPQAWRGSLRWGMDGALASMAALRAWAAWTSGVMSCASGRWAQ